jgi:hypothetical protein
VVGVRLSAFAHVPVERRSTKEPDFVAEIGDDNGHIAV